MCRKLTWLVSLTLLLGLVSKAASVSNPAPPDGATSVTVGPGESVRLRYASADAWKASNPIPSDGATDVSPNVILSWDPPYGYISPTFDVYLGTNFDAVYNAKTSDPEYVGNVDSNQYDPSGPLDFGETYYWRADTVVPLSRHKGNVWSFTTTSGPVEATNPSPADGAEDVDPNMLLSWDPGSGATSHDVYFGTDFDAVANADTSDTTGVYRGRQAVDANSYDPGDLVLGTSYYWRTDTVRQIGEFFVVYTGSVWSFTTEATPPPPPSEPTNPSPSDGATDQSIDVGLSWSNGGGATSYEVYFGTDPTPDSGEYKGSQTGTSYNPGTLNYDTTYYWRTDALNSSGTTTGSVWSFTTSGPIKATNPSPADGAIDVPIDVVLSWNPGYGATSHDVYFDTSSPPAFVGNYGASSYDPGTLEPDVRYYWQIDGVNNLDPCSPWQGDIWRFTTVSATDPNEPNEPKWKTGYKGYYTTDEENTVEVPLLTKPWNKADSNNQITVTLKSGEYIWFAFINLDDANKSKRKYFQLILKGDAVSNLEKPEEVKGFEETDDKKEVKVRRCGGPRWGRHEGKVTRRFRYRFGPPQPLWERFKFKAKRDITGETITIMAWSICCGVEYWKGGTWPTLPEVKSFGIGGPGAESGVLGVTNIENYAFSIWDASFLSQSPGAVIGDPRITDIYVFPDSSTVNTLVPPSFSADPSTGNWTASFVYTDPNGDSRPQGGVLFASDGPGLGTSDRFNLKVFLAGLIDSTYELYAYDQDSGQYMDFGIDVDIPECNEVVDDMESYTDDLGNRIFEAWIDGLGFTYPLPGHPGNGTGSMVDISTDVIRGGAQSMRFTYNNSGRFLYYSETERTFDPPQDWTAEGVKALSLWFYGDPNNDPEPIYVAVKDSTGTSVVVYNDNPDAAQIDNWTGWNTDLRQFADQGVDLTNVSSIAIGFGNRDNPQLGGTGTVYFDNITLRMDIEPGWTELTFPYDGLDHVFAEDLDALPHKGFVINSSEDNIMPFEVYAIDSNGLEIPYSRYEVLPGMTSMINIEEASLYAFHMPMSIEGPAALTAYIRVKNEDVMGGPVSRKCDGKDHLIVVSPSGPGTYEVTVNAFHYAFVDKEISQCDLEVRVSLYNISSGTETIPDFNWVKRGGTWKKTYEVPSGNRLYVRIRCCVVPKAPCYYSYKIEKK